MEELTPDIWIVGAGGVGCALAGHLAAANPGRVLLVDEWVEHVEALRSDGLVVSYRGDEVRTPVAAAGLAELDRSWPPPSFVVLAVKTFDTVRTMAALAPHIGDAPVVSLQNSLNEIAISEAVGAERTIGGVCLFDGALVGPGRATQTRPADKLVLGDLAGPPLARTQRIADVLRTAVPVEITDNIWGELWTKLILNSMLNGLSTITDLGLGDMVRVPGCVDICVGIAVESVPVATALGHELRTRDLIDCGVDYPVGWYGASRTSPERDRLRAAFFASYEHTRHVLPSMAQDVRKGRATEIAYMNGLIVDAARPLGLSTELNDSIVRLVRERETGRPPCVEEDVTALLDLVP